MVERKNVLTPERALNLTKNLLRIESMGIVQQIVAEQYIKGMLDNTLIHESVTE